MKIAIPVSLQTVFVGKAGASGSFKDPETGELIDYSDAYGFDFEDSEGVVQRLVLRASKIDLVADRGVDVAKLKRYVDRLQIEGNVVLNTEGRSFFKPSKVSLTPPRS